METSSPEHKRSKPNPPTTRLEEAYVPQYKAYRKACTNLAKSTHHLSVLKDFKSSNRIPKAFKPNIKSLVQTPNAQFVIRWEQAINDFGHNLVNILVDHWKQQVLQNETEVEKLTELIAQIPQEQKELIVKITDDLVKQTQSNFKTWNQQPNTNETEDCDQTHNKYEQYIELISLLSKYF